MHPVIDVASRTKLPPSPELRAMNAATAATAAHIPPFHVIENDDDISLSSSPLQQTASNKKRPRLRSIARYTAFRPQAICCSQPAVLAPNSSSASASENNNLLVVASSSTTITAKKSKLQQQQQQGVDNSSTNNDRSTGLTSVGAICGDKGVALFRVSAPHVPLLLLRHHSHATASNRPSSSSTRTASGAVGGAVVGVTSLAFQPNCPCPSSSSSSARGGSQLHLAAARGASVLVWDASGHSLSPLIGRLSVAAAAGQQDAGGLVFDLDPSSSSSRQVITSLAWQQSDSTSPWLAAATASHACLWDLRQGTATSGGGASSKPSLRFGATTAATNKNSPIVQLAASRQNGDECALLDAKGVVRIFDLRMSSSSSSLDQQQRRPSTAGILGSFRAFHHAGIGLSCLPNASGGSNNTMWLSWGMDRPDSDAVVKIWTRSNHNNNADVNPDTAVVVVDSSTDYWYMDGSPEHDLPPNRDGGVNFRLVAQCTTPNLACARVCPTIEENSFVTIGQEGLETTAGSATRSNPTKWKAELWKLSETLQLNKVVSFSAGDDANRTITSMDKDAGGLGPIIGAELAFSSIPRLVESDVDMEYTMIDKASPIRGLLLVSLTENGYVTTHSIPEAAPDILVDENPTVSETARVSSIQTRVFPDEKDWAIGDAAAAWGGVSSSDEIISREVRSSVENFKPDLDGSMVPFEMDFPVALPIASENLPQMPRVDMASPPGLSVAFNDPSQAVNNASTDKNVRDPAALMEDIERLGIPCPRLCGATFSPTVGGLVTFNNGAVKKMWTWYSSSTRTTEAGAAGPAAKLLHGDDAMFPDNSVIRDSPRTLQDLIEMSKAAKEAQWGGHDSDASSAGTHRMEENFFEDVSDEETSDSDGDVDELMDGTGGKQAKSNMYDQYFGEFRRPLSKPRSSSIETSSTGSKEQAVSKANSGDNLAGPSSDMLTPEVIVARAFDIISLYNQSQQLACQLDLGRWTEVNKVIAETSDLDESYQTTASQRPKKQELDSFPGQTRFASPARNNPMQHATSDPLLGTRTPKRLRHQSERVVCPPVTGNVSPYRYTGDERGVRGGEYGVRPNVQESMVFLRKLFTHQQQEGGGGGGGYAGLISPPDGPLLPSSLTPPGKRHTNPAVSSHRTALAKPGPSLPQPGVYTICADGLASRTSVRDKLVETRRTCLRNAVVCEKLGEQEKADVWELLSQVVDGRLIELAGANDRWRPRTGNALGTNLVSNTLRYYESLGDVQMLSTIVCVLRSKLPASNRSKICHSDYSLLPAGDDAKYDAYLRIYADLLYGWGLLSIRAEVNKHLVHVIHSRENAAETTIPKSMDRTPGIALVFTCPTCGEDTDIGTNYCRSCYDFAFRCIICDQAVRGLLSVCDRENCRHGGHPSCLKEWFSLHRECPSGCGCNCTLLSPVILSAPEPGPVINEFI